MAGAVADPGTPTGPPFLPNAVECMFADRFGDKAPMKFLTIRTATTPQDIALINDTLALSNAAPNTAGAGVRLTTSGAPTSGTNDSVSTKAFFIFQDPTTKIIAKYQVPAPLDSIFLADHITVDTVGNAAVTAFLTALAAIGVYSDGAPIVPSGSNPQLLRAYRWQKRGTQRRVARTRE